MLNSLRGVGLAAAMWELAFHVQCPSLTPEGVVCSSLWRAAAGEGAEAHDLQPGEVFGACRRGRRRWGARSLVRRRSDVFFGACRRRRRRGGLGMSTAPKARGAEGAELPRESRRVQLRAHVAAAGEGAEAICSLARVGVGEGAGACSSTNSGSPRALLGTSVAFGSGCG